MDHLVLIDSNSLIHRAYHAFPATLQSQKGELTNATFGFTKALLKAIQDLKPTHLAAAFDRGEPTFRHQKYDGYKAHREKMPDDLFNQLGRIKEILIALNIPIFEMPGFEADDLVGTLACKAMEIPNLKITIITGDYDALQLVRDKKVEVWTPSRGTNEEKTYNEKAVEEKYGFGPNFVVDFKALKGDPSDAIPGVSGIGDITAMKLIQGYGNIESIFQKIESGERLDIVSEKIQAKLVSEKDQACLSKDLATIDTNVPIKLNLDACQVNDYDMAEVKKIFSELDFQSLLKNLPKSSRYAGDSLFAEEETLKSQLDMRLEPVLREMEKIGVKIDVSYLKTLEIELNRETEKIKNEVIDYAGQDFNLDSPSQLATILYEKLQIPNQTSKKGKAGHFSTNARSLEKLKGATPIAEKILKYRELNKLLTTYIRPLPKLADEHGRVHTHYAPDTLSGRLSSKEPNLQNIPIKNETGRKIRQAFIAGTGLALLSADYSQIELRIAAHLSKDENMIETFQKGEDIHQATCEKMGVDRRIAKIINFSVLYGKRAYGLAEDLKIDLPLAQEFIDTYFQSYPDLRKYLNAVIEETRKNGFIQTFYGKKRYFPNINSDNFHLRASAEREAANHPIQGTAAEILKMAMLQIKPKKIAGSLILTVHDELVLEIQEANLKEAGKIVKEAMENVVSLLVPLKVELKTGKSWGELAII